MCPQLLNTIGLFAGIIGTILIYKWGISYQRESYGRGLENGTKVNTKWGEMPVSEAKIKAAAEEASARCLSKVGIVLIGIGFIFQLVAVWV